MAIVIFSAIIPMGMKFKGETMDVEKPWQNDCNI